MGLNKTMIKINLTWLVCFVLGCFFFVLFKNVATAKF